MPQSGWTLYLFSAALAQRHSLPILLSILGALGALELLKHEATLSRELLFAGRWIRPIALHNGLILTTATTEANKLYHRQS